MQSLQDKVKKVCYLRDELRRIEPGEFKAGDIWGDRPESFHKVSGNLSLRDALLELRNSADSEINGKFNAVLVVLDGNKLGIISVGTLAEGILRGNFAYDTPLKEICEPLYLASEDEDYRSMGRNNFGVVDKRGNLIRVGTNPSYVCLTSGSSTQVVVICG